MAGVNTNVTVKALMENWSFSIKSSGTNGTRVYLEDAGGTTTLPQIGDAWSADYPYVTLKETTITYLQNSPDCPRKFTCYYDGTNWIEALVSPDELPTSLEASGEFISYKPFSGYGSTFFWYNTINPPAEPTKVDQMLYKNIGVITFKLQRTVKDIDDYIAKITPLLCKTNDAEFRGFPVGTVLFSGANTYQYTNKWGAWRWKSELMFVFRKIKAAQGVGQTEVEMVPDSWNYILREDTGKFDRPVYCSGSLGQDPKTYLYQQASFEPLFAGPEDTEDELIENPPSD